MVSKREEEEKIKLDFGKFGSIEDVRIASKKSVIVTFCFAESAKIALDNPPIEFMAEEMDDKGNALKPMIERVGEEALRLKVFMFVKLKIEPNEAEWVKEVSEILKGIKAKKPDSKELLKFGGANFVFFKLDREISDAEERKLNEIGVKFACQVPLLLEQALRNFKKIPSVVESWSKGSKRKTEHSGNCAEKKRRK